MMRKCAGKGGMRSNGGEECTNFPFITLRRGKIYTVTTAMLSDISRKSSNKCYQAAAT